MNPIPLGTRLSIIYYQDFDVTLEKVNWGLKSIKLCV